MAKSSRSVSSSTGSSITKLKTVLAPNVVQEQGLFVFPTGDSYDGYFEAKKKDRSVKMSDQANPSIQMFSGPGTYTSAQGDSYNGVWDNDKLVNMEAAHFSFPDGSRYEGTLNNSKYLGHGMFVYPDGTELSCEFAENCPVGHLTLVDPIGHKWLGQAEKGYAWFQPQNHYYHILDSRLEGKSHRKGSKPLAHRERQ